MKYVIDRIDGGFAVIELSLNRWANVPIALIPGAKEGDIINIEILPGQTKERKEKMTIRLEDLFDEEI